MSRTRLLGLDGVRGLAALAVLFFHLDLGWTANGFVGVDVFFVLSGFLITGLLLDEAAGTGRIALKRFYGGRMLRLYPALVAVCAVAVILALLAHARVSEVLWGALASILYVANFWIYGGRDTILLQHTWTLALEEQYYLVWPPVIALVAGRGRRWLPTLVGVGGLALLVLGCLLVPAAVASYVRASGLLLGAVLAVWLRGRGALESQPRWWIALAGVAGAVLAWMLFLSGRVLDHALFTTSVSPAVPLTAIVIAAIAMVPGGKVPGLSHPVMLWLGARSYGLYLWHFPIASIVLHNLHLPAGHAVRAAAGAILSLVAAEFSYRIVETPFLRLKAALWRRAPA